MWDILPAGTVLGGAPFNFAYRINSLGDKGIFVSRLGNDEMGRKALEMAESLGIDTFYLQRDEKYPTGTVEVSFDKDNNPDYVIIPDVSYDQIEMSSALRDAAVSADCFYFGTLVQRSPKTRSTLEELLEISDRSIKLLDINLRKKCYSHDTVVWSLRKADILKLNGEEAEFLSEMLQIKYKTLIDFCNEMTEKWSLSCCLVTLGETGAFAYSNEGKNVYVPGYKIEFTDSLGSGDAFTAGFIHCYLRGLSLEEACELGNIMGAITATQKGATQPISKDMIEEFKNSDYERLYADGFAAV